VLAVLAVLAATTTATITTTAVTTTVAGQVAQKHVVGVAAKGAFQHQRQQTVSAGRVRSVVGNATQKCIATTV
jgi:hypothetical protein